MLDTLIASRPLSWAGRYFSAGSVSTVVHGAIIAGLAVATVQARPRAVQFVDTTLVFISPNARPEPAKPADEQPVERQLVIAGAALRGFQTVASFSEIPTTIPPIDLAERFDPRDYSGVGVEGGVADGVPVDPALVTSASSFVYAANITEEPPELRQAPDLVYPPLLRQGGVEGTVMLEFVVDTEGRVEANTVNVVSCSHPGFQMPAVDLARRAVFRPGRVGGRAVRVLVRMPVTFALARAGA
jgi:protein TonB